MIRQICLSCYKMTELADDAAGKQVTCPNCGKPMDVPTKYAPDVAAGGGVASVSPPPPPPPPPVTATAPPPGLTPPPGLVVPTQSPPMPGEYAGGVGFTLNPAWLAWVPLGCLVVAFILSFFTWAKLAPGGYTVLTQSGWEAAFREHDGVVYELKEWKELESSLRDRMSYDLFLIPYMLLLIPLVLLAVLERVYKPGSTKLPGPLLWVPQVWPYFLYLLAGLSLLLLVLLSVASLRGFSMERAVSELALAKYQPELDKNLAGSDLKKVNIQIGQEAAKFGPRQTSWVNLLLLLHVLTVLALLARIWLNTRSAKPHPRVGVQW